MPNTLQLVVILLAIGVPVSVACNPRLRLPPILGYLLVGIGVGPHALGWIPDSKEARYLAEFGVVFLMFSIGLEFSFCRSLKAMRKDRVRAQVVAGPADPGWRVAFAVVAGLGLEEPEHRRRRRARDVVDGDREQDAGRDAARAEHAAGQRSQRWACCCSRTWRSCRC